MQGKIAFNTVSTLATVQFSPDSRHLATTYYFDGAFDQPEPTQLWDIDQNIAQDFQINHQILGIGFNQESALLATTCESHKTIQDICVWDITQQKQILSIAASYNYQSTIAFSPTKNLLAIATAYSQNLTLWNTRTGGREARLPIPTVSELVFSPDGSRLAGRDQSFVYVWSVRPLKLLATIPATGGVGTYEFSKGTLGFSADNRTLAMSGNTREQSQSCEWGVVHCSITLWSLRENKQSALLKSGYLFANAIAFSPDGSIVAFVDRFSRIRIQDVQTGADLAILPHEDVMALSFSPDGLLIASVGLAGDIRLWGIAQQEF
jgi:WD40 repeat protein